jgi:hypothetical protein
VSLRLTYFVIRTFSLVTGSRNGVIAWKKALINHLRKSNCQPKRQAREQQYSRYINDDGSSHPLDVVFLQNSQDLPSRSYRGGCSRSCRGKVTNNHDCLHAGGHKVDCSFTERDSDLATSLVLDERNLQVEDQVPDLTRRCLLVLPAWPEV